MLKLFGLFGEILLLSLVIISLVYVFEYVLQRILDKKRLSIRDEIRELIGQLQNEQLPGYERAYAVARLGNETLNAYERQIITRILKDILLNNVSPEAVKASAIGVLGEINIKKSQRILGLIASNKSKEKYARTSSIYVLSCYQMGLKAIHNIAKDTSEQEEILGLAIMVIMRYRNKIDQNINFLKSKIVDNTHMSETVRTTAQEAIKILSDKDCTPNETDKKIDEYFTKYVSDNQNMKDIIKWIINPSEIPLHS